MLKPYAKLLQSKYILELEMFSNGRVGKNEFNKFRKTKELKKALRSAKEGVT